MARMTKAYYTKAFYQEGYQAALDTIEIMQKDSDRQRDEITQLKDRLAEMERLYRMDRTPCPEHGITPSICSECIDTWAREKTF